MAPRSTGKGRSPSRGRKHGESPSRKSDSSKKSSSSSYGSSSESKKSSDSRKGPPTNPPIPQPPPAPEGFERIKGTLVPAKGENWLPPPRPEKKIPQQILKQAQALSSTTEMRDGKPYNPREKFLEEHTPVSDPNLQDFPF